MCDPARATSNCVSGVFLERGFDEKSTRFCKQVLESALLKVAGSNLIVFNVLRDIYKFNYYFLYH